MRYAMLVVAVMCMGCEADHSQCQREYNTVAAMFDSCSAGAWRIHSRLERLAADSARCAESRQSGAINGAIKPDTCRWFYSEYHERRFDATGIIAAWADSPGVWHEKPDSAWMTVIVRDSLLTCDERGKKR